MFQTGRKISIVFSLLCICSITHAQHHFSSENELVQFLSGKNQLVDSVIRNHEEFRLQLIYTPVEEGRLGHTTELLTGQYFYPASTVKLPAAILTLEKLRRLGLHRENILKLNDDISCGSKTFIERSKERNISFEEMISELLVVSDNHYYNSLYHFLHPGEINSALKSRGFTETKIYKAFTGCEAEDQLICNSFDVRSNSGSVLYSDSICVMPMSEFESRYHYYASKMIGEKHENPDGDIVPGPFDFNYNLEIPLNELHEMLQRLMFPNEFHKSDRWSLSEEDREFLIRCLAAYPRQLKRSKFRDPKAYPDNIYKYILVGDGEVSDPTISKIGLSYGFTTETAFVPLDMKNGYFLTVSLYTNRNATVNDGEYEYEEVARPFLAEIGKILAEKK